jgi:hypothetical protein
MTLVAIYLIPPGRPTPTPPADAQPTLGTAIPSTAPLAPLGDAVVVVDGKFDDRFDRKVNAPTGTGGQSKLWFADGSWWGILVEPTSHEARIQRLDWATQRWHDSGVVVDERPSARADALFDGTHLYVASSGSRANTANAVRVSRFSFDPASDRWALDPDFPVRINETGVESALIERASDGTLWVGYVTAGRLQVAHSLGDDHRWTDPFTPASIGTASPAVAVGLAATGDRIGVLWIEEGNDSLQSTSHRAGDPDSVWAPPTSVGSGLRPSDNRLSVKALADGRLFAAVDTSLDTVPNHAPGWDQLLLFAQKPDGSWLGRQFGQIRDKHARPVVLLDRADDEVLVLASSPAGGGAIYMKHGPLDDPRFTAGVGAPVIATTQDAKINDATSTKQPLDAVTGFVVLSSDDSTGRYVHTAGSLAGGPPPGRPETGAPPPDGPIAAPAGSYILVDDAFDPFRVGGSPGGIWGLSNGHADGTLRVVTRSGSNLAMRLRTSGTGGARACRDFGAGTTGTVTIGADVRLDRIGQRDITMLMARGSGIELAGIRVDRQGRVRVDKRGGRETTTARLVPGSWYRIALRLDVAARRYRVEIAQANGRVLLRRTGLAWRSADATLVDGICVEAPAEAAGLGLSVDRVEVVRVP